jgi:hypothetical protein
MLSRTFLLAFYPRTSNTLGMLQQDRTQNTYAVFNPDAYT